VADELFKVPEIKPAVGWRMNEQDMKNMRLLMADRKEKKVSNLLRALVEQEAALVRQRMLRSAARIAALQKEAEDG
jgi:hypothetical protein